MELIIDLRTPSILYNHGGYYAPVDPRHCNTPGGPCGNCQERIDMEEAAQALLALAAPRSPPCCADRPPFLEPCPSCSSPSFLVTHTSRGLPTCNGCRESVCTNCFDGARYFCPLRTSTALPPPGPLERQTALGVQSPKAQEKTENKK